MIPVNVFSLLLLLSGINLIQSDPCLKKSFGYDSFVCVCNATYCDTLEPTINTSDGLIYSFISDRKDHRLNQEVFKPEDLATLGNDDSVVLSIDIDDLKQQIIGFGGAFTDSAGINIKSLPTDLQTTLLRDYFDKNGLEYTMGRVCVGGSDFSTRPYTYQDDYEDLDWSHFALANEDFEYKIPLIKTANELSGGLKLFASMWSPPAWMKYQNRINGTGILKGDPGGPYWKAMANYLVRFLDEYKENGVEFWGLTTLNEPSSGFVPEDTINTLGISAEMFVSWISKDLGPALEAAGYGKDKLELMIGDDFISHILLYATRILTSSDSAQYVSGIAVHWYDNDVFGYRDFDEIHARFPDYFILSTEACGLNGLMLGGWSLAENYTNDIIQNLNHWGTGWVDWNLALNMEAGPNWSTDEAGTVDAAIIVNAEASEYYKQPAYYALAHFTKFLKPGSTRLGVNFTNTDPSIKTTVFKNTEDQIVIVSLNRNDHAVNMTVKGVTQEPFGVTLHAHSIRTLVINKSD